jgi:DNA-binding MarR family transcriptional regulator
MRSGVSRKIPLAFERATRALFTRILAALAIELRDEDLSVSQLAILHLVYEDESLRMAAMTQRLELSPSVASRLVDDLVHRGLVLRREDDADRRAKVLSLSHAGAAFVDRASEVRGELLLETMRAHLPRLAIAAVLKAMEKVGARTEVKR